MNPFDAPEGLFLVLTNHEHRHSLWPSRLPVPTGWQVVHNQDTREACLTHIEKNWTPPHRKSGGRRRGAV